MEDDLLLVGIYFFAVEDSWCESAQSSRALLKRAERLSHVSHLFPFIYYFNLKMWFCLRSLEDKRHFLPHKTYAQTIFKNIFSPVSLTSKKMTFKRSEQTTNLTPEDRQRSVCLANSSGWYHQMRQVDLTMCLHSDGWRSIESCSDLDWQFTSHKKVMSIRWASVHTNSLCRKLRSSFMWRPTRSQGADPAIVLVKETFFSYSSLCWVTSQLGYSWKWISLISAKSHAISYPLKVLT